jgi:hypothetical protein
MDERSTKVGELLHEAAETHHQVFRIRTGADDDWASWSSAEPRNHAKSAPFVQYAASIRSHM